eukprot:Hpha_TRINITY_DN300_c0_g1::TRINITY_DN300_c0_g1_i1::g.112572::m.112572
MDRVGANPPPAVYRTPGAVGSRVGYLWRPDGALHMTWEEHSATHRHSPAGDAAIRRRASELRDEVLQLRAATHHQQPHTLGGRMSVSPHSVNMARREPGPPTGRQRLIEEVDFLHGLVSEHRELSEGRQSPKNIHAQRTALETVGWEMYTQEPESVARQGASSRRHHRRQSCTVPASFYPAEFSCRRYCRPPSQGTGVRARRMRVKRGVATAALATATAAPATAAAALAIITVPPPAPAAPAAPTPATAAAAAGLTPQPPPKARHSHRRPRRNWVLR